MGGVVLEQMVSPMLIMLEETTIHRCGNSFDTTDITLLAAGFSVICPFSFPFYSKLSHLSCFFALYLKNIESFKKYSTPTTIRV